MIKCPFCGEEYTNNEVSIASNELAYIHPADSYVAYPNSPSAFYKKGCPKEILKQSVSCNKCKSKYQFNVIRYTEDDPKVKNKKCKYYLGILSGKTDAIDKNPLIISLLNRFLLFLENKTSLDLTNDVEKNMFLASGLILISLFFIILLSVFYLLPYYILQLAGAQGNIWDTRVIIPVLIAVALLFLLWRHNKLLNKFIDPDTSPLKFDHNYIGSPSYNLYKEKTLNGLLNGHPFSISTPTLSGIIFVVLYWIALILNYNHIINEIPIGTNLIGILVIAWFTVGLIAISSLIYFIFGNAIIIGLSTLTVLWLITSSVPLKIESEDDNTNLQIIGKLIFSYIFLIAGSILIFVTEYGGLENIGPVTLLILSHYINDLLNYIVNMNIDSLVMVSLYVAFLLLVLFAPAIYVHNKINISKKNKKKEILDEIQLLKSIDSNDTKIMRLNQDIENISKISEWPFDMSLFSSIWRVINYIKDLGHTHNN